MSMPWSACITADVSDPAVLIAFMTCIGLVAVAFWIRRYPTSSGQNWFRLSLVSMILWLSGTAFQVSSDTFACKHFWELADWPPALLLPTAWAFFLYEYAHARKVPRWAQVLCIGVLPTILAALAFTNDSHHLIYGEDSRLMFRDGRLAVDYHLGPVYYLSAAYIYLLVIGTCAVSFIPILSASIAVRSFFQKLLALTFLPAIANLLYIFFDFTIAGLDPAPFSFTVSLIGVYWLMIDNRWIDVHAMGRDILYYNAVDPVFIVGTDGTLSDASPAAHRLFDIGSKREPVARIDGIGPLFEAIQRDGAEAEADLVQRHGRSFAPRFYPIEFLGGRSLLGWVIALVDVTEQEAARQLAQAADRSKTQFIATVSHELRTPLTVIAGAVKLMAEKDLDRSQFERLIKMTINNVSALTGLVNDLLDVQSFETGNYELSLEAMDLCALTGKACDQIRGYMPHKGVEIALDTPDDPVVVNADIRRLEQVLTNVLSNAVKFSARDSTVSVEVVQSGGKGEVRITDTGMGIPAGSEDIVFGRFTQVDSSDERQSGGSGLGMNISRQIMNLHGGTIRYESEMGQGTTFFITLPVS